MLRPRKIKAYEIILRQQQFFHSFTYHYLGLNPHSRWDYPEIYDWDWSEETGYFDIPSYLAFWIEPTKHIPFDTMRNFIGDINRRTRDHYQAKWEWHNGFVWVIRRHISYTYNYYVPTDIQAPIHEVSKRYSTLEWEAQLRAWESKQRASRNGQITGENGEAVREVRTNIFRSEIVR